MNVAIERTEKLVAVGYDTANNSQRLFESLAEYGLKGLESERSDFYSEYSNQYKVTITIESV